ncbi:hypothetical protein JI57_03905 [Psychromonas sp. PRT-SC03]|nr:hypothetical protein JI57_03905 [Psychromonas sp. PRT-SC03]
MLKLNAVFITLLGVSLASNVFFYKSMVHTSKSLIQSEQSAQLFLSKNSALAKQITSMQNGKIRSQQVADALQKEVFALNKQSQKIRVVIKEVIKNAPCYREPIIYPPTLSLHYE